MSTVLCKTEGCKQHSASLRDGRWLFTWIIFSFNGHKIIQGYCLDCANKRLADSWLAMLCIIGTALLIVGFSQLPDPKPLLGIGFVLSVLLGTTIWLRKQSTSPN